MAVIMSKQMTIPIRGKRLSDYAEGETVKINESGSPVKFYVAKHNYESDLNGAGRTLLVRNTVTQGELRWSYSGKEYSGCIIDTYFNETYKALLDSVIQTAIGTTTFEYRNRDTFLKTLSRPVFTVSATEIFGKSNDDTTGTDYYDAGEKLPIAQTLVYGPNAQYWTRSISLSSSTGMIYNAGRPNAANGTTIDYPVLPCFTLSGDTLFDPKTDEFLGVG